MKNISLFMLNILTALFLILPYSAYSMQKEQSGSVTYHITAVNDFPSGLHVSQEEPNNPHIVRQLEQRGLAVLTLSEQHADPSKDMQHIRIVWQPSD